MVRILNTSARVEVFKIRHGRSPKSRLLRQFSARGVEGFLAFVHGTSRHHSVRSLERYARPGADTVARHVTECDPAARRRT
jgi:hypothetical protein